MEILLDTVSISVNKNSIPSDTKPMYPNGIRFGLSSLTTKGFKESEIKTTFNFIIKTMNVGKNIKKEYGSQHFIDGMDNYDGLLYKLRYEVESFASIFHETRD